jgi:hypothetical protein
MRPHILRPFYAHLAYGTSWQGWHGNCIYSRRCDKALMKTAFLADTIGVKSLHL